MKKELQEEMAMKNQSKKASQRNGVREMKNYKLRLEVWRWTAKIGNKKRLQRSGDEEKWEKRQRRNSYEELAKIL